MFHVLRFKNHIMILRSSRNPPSDFGSVGWNGTKLHRRKESLAMQDGRLHTVELQRSDAA